MMKKRQCLALALSASLVLTGLSDTSFAQAATKKITFNKKTVKVAVGSTTTLKLKNNKKKVKWSISKKKIAALTVKNKNTVRIKGKKKGKATIIAKVAGKKYTCKLTVSAKKGKNTAVTAAPKNTATGAPSATTSTPSSGSNTPSSGSNNPSAAAPASQSGLSTPSTGNQTDDQTGGQTGGQNGSGGNSQLGADETKTTAEPPVLSANPNSTTGLIAKAASTDERVQGISIYSKDNVNLIEVFGDFVDIRNIVDSIGYSYSDDDVTISMEYKKDAYFSDGTPGYYSIQAQGTLDGETVTQTYFLGRAGKFQYYKENSGLIQSASSSDARVEEISVYNDGYTHRIEVSGDFDSIKDVKDTIQYTYLNDGVNESTAYTYSPEAYWSDDAPGYYSYTVSGDIGGGTVYQTYFLVKANALHYSNNHGGEYNAVIDGYTGWGDQLVLPDTLDGIPVTEIGYYSFHQNDVVKEVVVPDGVMKIGWEAFYNCSNLEKVTLPEGLQEIGGFAFYYNQNLSDIDIPESVQEIGESAFDSTEWMTNRKKDREDSLVIVNGILVDGSSANGTVVIPDGVTSIADGAFTGSYVRDLTIPDSVKKIGEYAFSYCSYLETVTLPSNLKKIGEMVFKHCGRLTQISLPDGLQAIYPKAFQGCSSLENITIPESVETIYKTAFVGTAWLEAQRKTAEEGDGLVIVNHIVLDGKMAKGEVVIPDDVTKIATSAFRNCTSVTKVTIPASVTDIGGSAFYGCSALTQVTLSEGLKNIRVAAFEETGLQEVTIPDGVEYVGSWSFAYCESLTKITFPKTITRMGGCICWGCGNNLKVYAYDDSFSKYTMERDGWECEIIEEEE